MRRQILLAIILTFVSARQLPAYPEVVHRKITERAAEKAQIDYLGHLGIDPLTVINGNTPLGWMSQGADDEDHPSAQVLNHFLDPAHDNNGSALAVPISLVPFFCMPVGVQADIWAINGYGLNSYSLEYARWHYRMAVIGRNPGTRDAALKELFLSLGHGAHLVQDMAQPEHVRNDQHLTGSQWFTLGGIPPAASLYEAWAGQFLPGNSMVPFDGYPTVHLPTYRSYFSTPSGQGMADYGNRNFVTQDTNYNDEMTFGKCYYYSSPPINPDGTPAAAYPRTIVAAERVLTGIGYITMNVSEDVFSYYVDDRLYGPPQDLDPFHAYRSSLDLETRLLGATTYSLGPESFASRANMLIPRAVAYSAGLMEHFFRGTIDAKWEGNAINQYNITITNTSNEFINSSCELVISYRPGARYLGNTNSDDAAFLFNHTVGVFAPNGLAPGESVTIPHVSVPGLQFGDSITMFERRIAITGLIGGQPSTIGLVQGAQPGKRKFVVDCWSGGGLCNTLPGRILLSGLYSDQNNHNFVPADVASMPLYPSGTPYIATCTFNDPLPQGAKITRVDVTPYTRSQTAGQRVKMGASINSFSLPSIIKDSTDGCGWVNQPQWWGLYTTLPVNHMSTGPLASGLPGYISQGTNMLTVTGMIERCPQCGPGFGWEEDSLEAVVVEIFFKP